MKKTWLCVSLLAIMALTGCQSPAASSGEASASESASSGSLVGSHLINKVITGGGDLSFSSLSAVSGTTITVTVNPLERYALSSISSLDVTLTAVQEGSSYTFVMPDTDVTINANFTKVVAKRKVVSFNNYSSYSATLSGISIGDEFAVGSEAKASFLFDGYRGGLMGYINGEAHDLTQDTANPSLFSFSFTVPDADLELSLFSPNDESTTGAVYTLDVDSHVTLVGIESGKKYSSPHFYLKHETGYEVAVSAFVTATKVAVTCTLQANYGLYYEVSAYDSDFNSITDPITIKVTATNVGVKAISYAGTEHMNAANSSLPSSATPGDPIKVVVDPAEGYYFAKASFSDTSLSEATNSSFSFVMPNADLTITFAINELGKVVMNNASHLNSYQLFDDYSYSHEISGYIPGKTLYVKFATDDGYRVTGLADSASSITFSTWMANQFQGDVASDFTGTLTLTPTVSQGHSVTFATVEHVTFSLQDEADSVFYPDPNNSVYFNVTPDDGYRITAVSSVNGTAEVQNAYDNTYYFTKGDKDVEITATVEALVSATVTFDSSTFNGCTINYSSSTSTSIGGDLAAGGDSSFTCHVGDVVTLSITVPNNHNKPLLTVAQGTEAGALLPLEISGPANWMGQLTISDSSVTASLALGSQDVRTGTVVMPSDVTGTYSLNGGTASTLAATSGIHGVVCKDSIAFTLSAPASGKAYEVTVGGTDTLDNLWAENDEGTQFSFTVPDFDFTLTIAVVAA